MKKPWVTEKSREYLLTPNMGKLSFLEMMKNIRRSFTQKNNNSKWQSRVSGDPNSPARLTVRDAAIHGTGLSDMLPFRCEDQEWQSANRKAKVCRLNIPTHLYSIQTRRFRPPQEIQGNWQRSCVRISPSKGVQLSLNSSVNDRALIKDNLFSFPLFWEIIFPAWNNGRTLWFNHGEVTPDLLALQRHVTNVTW